MNKIEVIAYADDLVIISRGKFIDTVSSILEHGLNMLRSWAKTNGLNINPTKTDLVLFSRKRNIPQFNEPMIDGTPIKLSEQAKFLGVIFDKKLNWKANIESRTKKGYAALYSCKNLLGKSWGLSPKLFYWLYSAVVRPVLCYGCIVWWDIVEKQINVKDFKKIHRMSLLGISRAKQSTSTAALENILGILPIDMHIKETAAKSALRLSQTLNIKENRGHIRIFTNYVGERTDSDYIISQTFFDNKVEVEFPSREQWEYNRVNINNEICIYTDGSKTSEGTGCGIYCEELNIRQSVKLKKDCSIFQAEVYAVFLAARCVSMRVISRSDITFFIDSQAAIKALMKRSTRSEVTSRCRQELMVLTEQHNVKLCWVPGHNDIPGNEIADELAKKATSFSIERIDNEVKLPMSFYESIISDKIKIEYNLRWESSDANRLTKSLWKYRISYSEYILKLSSKEIRDFIGIMTGHNDLKGHLYRIGKATDDLCRWCGDEFYIEDTEHILCWCTKLTNVRYKIFGKFYFQNTQELIDKHPAKIMQFIRFVHRSMKNSKEELH